MQEDISLTISVSEAGRLLGVSRKTAYKMAKRGEIPSIRIGKHIKVLKSGLANLLK